MAKAGMNLNPANKNSNQNIESPAFSTQERLSKQKNMIEESQQIVRNAPPPAQDLQKEIANSQPIPQNVGFDHNDLYNKLQVHSQSLQNHQYSDQEDEEAEEISPRPSYKKTGLMIETDEQQLQNRVFGIKDNLRKMLITEPQVNPELKQGSLLTWQSLGPIDLNDVMTSKMNLNDQSVKYGVYKDDNGVFEGILND